MSDSFTPGQDCHSLCHQTILITGGTGSFGKAFVRAILGIDDCAAHPRSPGPQKVIILSRDELKQYEMAKEFQDERLRFFLGDVRDRDRLYRAFTGVDVVVHAAALKQVPACEYNPLEAIKTNVGGAANIVDAAIDCNVQKVIGLSTDKAVNPVNLYGATKLCSDKLLVSANAYAGEHTTRFAVVRYGNVVGSRGSVVPFFKGLAEQGESLKITDPEMTRFWITLPQAVQFVLDSLDRMKGGEIFVPKIPSMRIADLAQAIAPTANWEITGIRPGEKLHESLVSEDEARNTFEYDGYFAIHAPSNPGHGGTRCSEGFSYRSDRNGDWLSVEDLSLLV